MNASALSGRGGQGPHSRMHTAAESGTGSLGPRSGPARLPHPHQPGPRTQASWRPDTSVGLETVSRRLFRTTLLRVLGRGVEGGTGFPVHGPAPTRLCHNPLHTLSSYCVHPGHQARRSGHRTRGHAAGPGGPVTTQTTRHIWGGPVTVLTTREAWRGPAATRQGTGDDAVAVAGAGVLQATPARTRTGGREQAHP